MRHIREVIGKSSLKLKQSTARRLPTNVVNMLRIPSVWIQDYNDSIWNDTESNITILNDTALLPSMKLSTERKDDLIFGFLGNFWLRSNTDALPSSKLCILDGVISVIFTLITVSPTIACYFDCENRRSYLPSTKYRSITKDAVPMIAVKYAEKQLDIKHEKKTQKDVTPESLVHSRTLRKRKMLIEAQRSASSQSGSLSDMPDAKLKQIDIMKGIRIYTIPQMAEIKSTESMTGKISSAHEASLSSSSSLPPVSQSKRRRNQQSHIKIEKRTKRRKNSLI
ncbi:hypothetical protein DINM_005921 [Dirofilaria immitis]|nr:hypothetical protein [Dirofilaria immitis]